MSTSELLARIVTLPDMKTKERTPFGERLYAARTHAKLSQTELAQRAGMTQTNVSHLEQSGHGSPKVATLARECGVRIAWLEKDEGPMLGAEDGDGAAVAAAEPTIQAYMSKPPSTDKDYRAVAWSMLEAVEAQEVPLTIRQFLRLVDDMHKRFGSG